MRVLRHEEFNSGCEASCNGPYARPWSKTMIGYGDEIDHFVFELTYNYGIKKYERGDDFVAIILAGKSAVVARAAEHNYTVHDENGETFVLSPDGYKFVLLDEPLEQGRDPVRGVAFNVSDLSRSLGTFASTNNASGLPIIWFLAATGWPGTHTHTLSRAASHTHMLCGMLHAQTITSTCWAPPSSRAPAPTTRTTSASWASPPRRPSCI